MGRYSSDSEEEKKKRKKKKKKRSRSRSRSESIESRHSTKPKKSKKKKKRRSRSRSRSPDRYRRSRSRSYDRRSRSRSRDRYRSRYSRSRSWSRDRRRRRSRSYDSHSRSSRRSRSYSPERKSRKNRSSNEREDPCANIPGFAEMTPAEQAKIRMHMALKAAAAADEKLKGDVTKSHSSTSLHDSMAFSQAIQDIESSSFAASSFKSSRGDRKEEKSVKDDFTFGTAGELKLDSQRKPVLVDVENEDLAHPSLYTDPEEKLDQWIQKLAAMRRKKLEGEALT
ncbi:serine/Arginine-related protein 53-like [Mercenaria mercenaria]|uniref:serine/Arginine-related protein 53-like n=1 Tax=Mercenaria mercenaria TaxID=6596 RepID=UPI001E1DCB79|nr:serine/Arginine-related protein 53-like [Mercenaria mercenaria]